MSISCLNYHVDVRKRFVIVGEMKKHTKGFSIVVHEN